MLERISKNLNSVSIAEKYYNKKVNYLLKLEKINDNVYEVIQKTFINNEDNNLSLEGI